MLNRNQVLLRRTAWGGLLLAAVAAVVTTAAARETQEETAPAAQPAASKAKSLPEGSDARREPSPARRITGVVVGPQGSPVAGAEVYLVGRESDHPTFTRSLDHLAWPMEREARGWPLTTLAHSRTDAAGRFAIELNSVSPMSWWVTIAVAAEGLALAHRSWDWKDRDVRIDVADMVPIRGRLLKPDATPAAGVLVEVRALQDGKSALGLRWTAEEDWPAFWPRPIRTASDGSFTLTGMPAGHHVELHFVHPAFAFETVMVDTGLGQTDESRVFERQLLRPTFERRLRPARPVEGVVLAADTGKPLAGVLISVAAMHPRGGLPIYGHTDSAGHYHVWSEFVDPGNLGCSYWMRVYPPPDSGYLSESKGCERWPDGAESLVQDFKLERGKTIRGRVVDAETDEPIRGASLVYRPSMENPLGRGHYRFKNPTLTDEAGRFIQTCLSGPGYLLVETPNRVYVRAPLTDTRQRDRPMVTGYTPLEVPETGTLQEEVVIRLRRGRTVTLRAVGPNGEGLPSVRAGWEGTDAVHDFITNRGVEFPDGSVVIREIPPSGSMRVFLLNKEQQLGAVFDVTPETPDRPIEVRLRPTATVVGQLVTPSGEPAEDSQVLLWMSFDPELAELTVEDRGRYECYVSITGGYVEQEPWPEGRFVLENVVPGAPFLLSANAEGRSAFVSVQPLRAGERRDLGKVVLTAPPTRPGP